MTEAVSASQCLTILLEALFSWSGFFPLFLYFFKYKFRNTNYKYKYKYKL